MKSRIGLERNKADRPANSRKRWAGALMEVRSLFFSWDGRTHGGQTVPRQTDGQTKRLIESLVRDLKVYCKQNVCFYTNLYMNHS